MIKAIYKDRLEKEGTTLVRIVNARWNTKKYGKGNMDVYKEYEDGKIYARNLYYNRLAGYLVDGTTPEDWWLCDYEIPHFKNDCTSIMTPEDFKLFTETAPGYKWMLGKLNIKLCGIVDIVSAWQFYLAWKKWPMCEKLANANLWQLAKSKKFAEMPFLKQKEIITWLKTNHPGKDIKLGWIAEMKKYGLTVEEYFCKKELKCNMDIIKYLRSQTEKGYFKSVNETARIYSDYKYLAIQLNHDMNDSYWKYPNNLRAAHNKVVEQTNIEEMNRKAKVLKKYARAIKKYIGLSETFNGMEIHVPETYAEIKNHAEKLHQCLIYANYIDKVANRQILLAFITKNGSPHATAEILKNGQVGQFYMDERDREHMHPGEPEKQLLNMFLEKYKPMKQRRNAA